MKCCPKNGKKMKLPKKNGKNGKWAYIMWPYFYSCVTIKNAQ